MTDSHPGEIVGISQAATAFREFVETAQRNSDPVTLIGEPGTGKQLAARLIHEGSARRRGPFLMIDCSLYYERELKREIFGYSSGVPDSKPRKGLFEFAAKGTCYLSRIEELSPSLQSGLLRFLGCGQFSRLGDGKEVSSGVRLVVSSDKNLQGLVEAGLFDQSLYAVLSRHAFRLSPLRERKEDIRGLVEYLANRHYAAQPTRERMVVTPEAMQALEAYPWPVNFDEITKEVQRLLESGITCVRSGNLSTEISSYWLGQHCDPDIRKVLEELDGYIREFKVMSRLESELGETVHSLDAWLSAGAENAQDPMEEF